MRFIVGLTGGIGSGKTTVANLFAELGVEIIDADVIAREVVKPNTEGLNAIVERFGTELLNTDGTLNRAVLRERIFSNEADKVWLNALLHPKIRQTMLAACQKIQSEYGILVIPLLVENGLQNLSQRVLVVDVDEETQIQRTVQRDGVNAEQVKLILASQATRQQRLQLADDVIKNNDDTSDLQQQVLALHQCYRQLARHQ